MPFEYRLGKKPARFDEKLPRLSKHAAGLPPPPLWSNWWAGIESWEMLENDKLGCCAEAAVLHQILQISTYANPGHALKPTNWDAIHLYEGAAGYKPNDPSTDQGTYMAGPGGLLDYWLKTGVICDGVLNKAAAVLAITKPRVIEWKQAIATFGSILIGLQLPENVLSGDAPPFVWSNPTGPVAGGHAVLGVGYDSATAMFDLVSWGTHYKATEDFLLGTVDEVYTVYDAAFPTPAGSVAALAALGGEG